MTEPDSIHRYLANAGIVDYRWHLLSPSWSNTLYWIQPAGFEAMLLRVHTPGVLTPERRQHEFDIWQRAASRRLAPKLLHVASDGSYCLAEWLDGQHVVRPHLVGMMFQKLLRFHQCVQPQDQPMDYRATLQELVDKWQQLSSTNDVAQLDHIWRAADVLSQTQTPPVLCHLDLNARNLLWGATHCWLLDFEYAACAHPILDVVQLAEEPCLKSLALQLVAWYEHQGYVMQPLWHSASVYHRGLTWLWYEVEAQRRQDPLYRQQANRYTVASVKYGVTYEMNNLLSP